MFNSKMEYLSTRKFVTISIVLMIVSGISSINSGFNYFASIVWLLCLMISFQYKDFYVWFLPLTLYQGTLLAAPGVLLIYVYLILYAAKVVLGKKIKLYAWHVCVMISVLLYCIIILPEWMESVVKAVLVAVQFAFLFHNIFFAKERVMLSRMLFAFSLLGISTIIYGLITNNFIDYRFCGALADPNYTGLYLVISMIAIFYTDIIQSKVVKCVCIALLGTFVLLTSSMTAILAISLAVLLHMIYNKKGMMRVAIVVMIIMLLLIVALNLSDVISILIDIGLLPENSRYAYQLIALSNGDVSEFSSLRTEIWEGYLDYYFNKQGLLRRLLGGNITGVYGIAENYSGLDRSYATHNTQIDVLMCLGLVGVILYTICFIKTFKEKVKAYDETGDRVYLSALSIKMIMLFYSFSLSQFLSLTDTGFYLF